MGELGIVDNYKPIDIVDGPMGEGKSSYAIEFCNDLDEGERVMYVTPYLDEVSRIIEAASAHPFTEPKEKPSKREHLKDLIGAGESIVLTHELFRSMTPKMFGELKEKEYHLIVDEVINVIDSVEVQSALLKVFMECGRISIDESNDNKVVWSKESNDDVYGCDAIDKIRLAALYGKLRVDGSLENSSVKIIKTIPYQAFGGFKSVQVLTYLFHGSVLKGFFDLAGIKYNIKTIEQIDGRYQVVEARDLSEVKAKYRRLINLIDDDKDTRPGRVNDIERSLSHTVMTNSKGTRPEGYLKRLSSDIENVIKNKFKITIKSDVMWTVYKPIIEKDGFDLCRYKAMTNKNEYGCFVPHNARATNNYGDRHNVVYAIDRHLNLDIGQFLKKAGVDISYDTYSLAEMIQFIWRSAIRNNEPINLYIPSLRMRALFKLWLHTDYFEKGVMQCPVKRKGLMNIDKNPKFRIDSVVDEISRQKECIS